jgi:hypothetical protein
MKSLSNAATYLILFLLSFTLTSCELIGDIFEGGVWTGIIITLLVIGVIIYGIAKLFGGRG